MKGFNFDNYQRNLNLQKTLGEQKFTKTGTTICAVCFKDGVVMAADSRASAGYTVADKRCMKLHHIMDHIWACGAGTAADNDKVGEMLSNELHLFYLNTGIKPRLEQAVIRLSNHLFPYQGYIGAHMIIGGVDHNGPCVYSISSAGNYHKAPFCANGSGSLYCTSVIENGFRKDMEMKEAMDLAAEGIWAGIHNDLGSGSIINICVVKKDGYQFFNNYEPEKYGNKNDRNFVSNRLTSAFEVEVLSENTTDLTPPDVHLEVLDGVPEQL